MSNQKSYVMPKPDLPLVRWFAQKGAPPAPALVLAQGERAIQAGIFYPGTKYMEIRDGVRHVSDPDIGRSPMADEQGGLWDFSELEKKIRVVIGEEYAPQ